MWTLKLDASDANVLRVCCCTPVCLIAGMAHNQSFWPLNLSMSARRDDSQSELAAAVIIDWRLCVHIEAYVSPQRWHDSNWKSTLLCRSCYEAKQILLLSKQGENHQSNHVQMRTSKRTLTLCLWSVKGFTSILVLSWFSRDFISFWWVVHPSILPRCCANIGAYTTCRWDPATGSISTSSLACPPWEFTNFSMNLACLFDRPGTWQAKKRLDHKNADFYMHWACLFGWSRIRQL